MQQWEYKKTINTLDEAELDQLGSQGWELVSVAIDSSTGRSYFYFKRPK